MTRDDDNDNETFLTQAEIETYAQQFIAALAAGGDAWIEAGDVINKLHEDDADAVYRRVQFYTESIAASGGRSRP
jgi:hypothetical protein